MYIFFLSKILEMFVFLDKMMEVDSRKRVIHRQITSFTAMRNITGASTGASTWCAAGITGERQRYFPGQDKSKRKT
ncbi:MAG: hypothetical protein R3E01_08620 [Pirellulaceae bacterium]|nr:hypothetical protein [Planctomycetales bacterium]